MNKICDTCIYWKPDDAPFDQNWGTCRRANHDDAKMRATDWNGEEPRLETKKNFSCNEYEDRFVSIRCPDAVIKVLCED